MAASSVDSFHTAPTTADEELTDEQIEQLLARATARLQEKAKQQQLTKSNGLSLSFPKLDAGQLEKPYVETKGDVATLDSSRLLDEKHRKQANGIRKVEDPATVKKAAAEVRSKHFLTSNSIPMRKFIP